MRYTLIPFDILCLLNNYNTVRLNHVMCSKRSCAPVLYVFNGKRDQTIWCNTEGVVVFSWGRLLWGQDEHNVDFFK